ncbi:MAG TPA: LacI family DNA-binding transcriptional regulator [Chloroflexota bacterium]|nr:LacI family DNA-binding transcriptional regulator [Chloroflexota bacterium]
MPSKKRVTHRDVARMAGVSTAVVSYVINDGPRATSPDARRRVLDAIETLSYHPSAAARGLRLQQTHTIGFISYDYYPQDAFFAPYNAGVLTGLTTALLAHRHYILPYPIGIGDDLRGLHELLRSGRMDGVVVRLSQEPPITDSLLAMIAAAGVPGVCIERAGAPRFGFSSVTYDDEGAAFGATTYLISQGHRRVAHIQGDIRQVAARDRLVGYRRALIEAELPSDDDLVQGGSWLPADAAAGMHRLLDLAEPPTAIFTANDHLALSIIEVLRSEGRRIPEDMAIIGFDDVPLSGVTVPPLTTVRIPFADLGQKAADLVLRLTQGNHDEPVAETVRLELVHRGTS